MKRKSALFKKILIGATAALLFNFPCFAEFDFYSIPDSADIRQNILDSWLKAPVSEVRRKSAEIVQNEAGVNFEVRYEENDDELCIVVAPQSKLRIDIYKEGISSSQSIEKNVYPKNSPGSWILYRDKSSGKPLRICYYFNPNADVYVQFRSEETKIYADMLIYDFYAIRSAPVGVSLNRLYTCSFADVYGFTKKILPWEYGFIVTGQYHPSLQMIEVIRQSLNKIKYTEDSCYDKQGKLYSITKESLIEADNEDYLYLSDAGFDKWIIDGIVEPITGENTDVKKLLNPTIVYDYLGKNGVLSQKYNLSFSLDWTRNLAALCLSMRTNKEYTYKTGGVDVTISPFVFYNNEGRICSTSGYLSNTGYEINQLKSLMYILSVTEPSWFYLLAIREASDVSYEDMAFNKSAVLFPYFDDDGQFGCVVFENGIEMSLDEFIKKYSENNVFVHIERVKATDDFFPKTK